ASPATGLASAYLTIYEASSNGLATGGGWFDSPAGACKLESCSTATGRANFGFNVKSRNGSTIGETEFHFQAGSLDFHSTAYNSFKIKGSQANFQGTGTVNGQTGTFTFTVVAVDNDDTGGTTPDTFEIQITNPAGVVIYDSQNAPVKRGDIEIHQTGSQIGKGE
ncbi:MAG TPA: post-COAP-1 domain-containing protein, partial [Chloroflexota bacterium]|nr:post-COAP-1 domain-containing protein [Chloroflexota bacterium]